MVSCFFTTTQPLLDSPQHSPSFQPLSPSAARHASPPVTEFNARLPSINLALSGRGIWRAEFDFRPRVRHYAGQQPERALPARPIALLTCTAAAYNLDYAAPHSYFSAPARSRFSRELVFAGGQWISRTSIGVGRNIMLLSL